MNDIGLRYISEARLSELVERGRYLASLPDAKAMDAVNTPFILPGRIMTTVSGRVMVDSQAMLVNFPAGYDDLMPSDRGPDGDGAVQQERPDDLIASLFGTGSSDKKPRMSAPTSTKPTEALAVNIPESDVLLAVMCPWMPAYCTATRQWGLASPLRMTDAVYQGDIMDKVVLPAHIKRSVQALVRFGHACGTDIVAGKEGGTTLLLHGDPGTGKTLLAEAVADQQRRPLLSIAAGTLGATAIEVEKGLQRALSLAARWDAVALIDEADVYLEERDSVSLERNAVVSVFLRIIEYHQGVLMLTTNRVKHFDRAFLSRVSLAIAFSRLTLAGRRRILSGLLRQVSLEHIAADVSDSALADLNARQIKNGIRQARALAAFDEKDVTADYLEDALALQSFDLSASPDVGSVDI